VSADHLPPVSFADDAESPSNNFVLAASRERISYWLAVIILVAVTPFAVNHFYHGHYTLACAILTVQLLLAVNAFAIHLKRRPPIPFALLLIPVAAACSLALIEQGLFGVLWCFPAVLFCFFVLTWRTAILCSVAMLLLFTPQVYFFVGPGVAIRFMTALGITIASIGMVTRIVNDLQRQLVDQIITDPLTGAFNRRHMNVALADALERYRRTAAPASVLVIDIDHFKKVNDDFGHPVGDQVLKAMVKIIKEKSRRLDRLFRMGGEEFLLFLPDTRASDAVVRAENLRQMIATGNLNPKRPVTISIGVSEIADDATPEAWIKRADDALYAAKQSGRNCVVCAPSAKHPDSLSARGGTATEVTAS
jgi:diguanylate cyclase (GGDEF)-like protein